MPERANIKVSRETFEELAESKGDQTWNQYLRDQCLREESYTLDDVMRALDALPEQTAEEIEERLNNAY